MNLEPIWDQAKGYAVKPWPYLLFFIALFLARWSGEIFAHLNRGRPGDALGLVLSSFLFGGLLALLFWGVVRIGHKLAKPKSGGTG